jgi:hypothetical protein
VTAERRRLHALLILAVALKLLFHAVYLPVWEGPDEPFHLGRILPGQSRAAGSRDVMLQETISRSVAANPCADDLRRVFDCQAFSGTGAFNALRPASPQEPLPREVVNYESHQPPTFYAFAGVLTRALAIDDPVNALLLVRLLSVALVLAGLILVARANPGAPTLLSLLLLFPGAAESLARAANDSMVFVMSAILAFALSRRNAWLIVCAIAIAPTVKLTAAPFIAAALIRLWMDGDRRLAVTSLLASLLVVPVQALRGWAWGGTVELNQARIAFDEPFVESAIGMARSLYTIAKTTLWLGNWSFFRAPAALLVVTAIACVALVLVCRPGGSRTSRAAFGGGLATLLAGVIAFAVAHRSLFGQWGGVGGWYMWGVMPWLAVGLRENLDVIDEKTERLALQGGIVLAVVYNALWLRAAVAAYGSW